MGIWDSRQTNFDLIHLGEKLFAIKENVKLMFLDLILANKGEIIRLYRLFLRSRHFVTN